MEASCKSHCKVKSLRLYVLDTIAEYIQDVASLQGIPDSVKVCVSRVFKTHSLTESAIFVHL